MFYYLYQITNLVNNKIYVGVHRTKDLNDGYMGSGKVIKRAIEKHGTGNFRKDILETFENAKAMYAREKEIVTEEFLAREDVYNLRRGGTGGFDYINKDPKSKIWASAAGKIGGCKVQEKYGKEIIKKLRVAVKIGHKEGKYVHTYFGARRVNGNTDCALVKKKETWKRTKRGVGEKNSQFNTIWITNGIENKKIKKSEGTPFGWYNGRVCKQSQQ